MHLCLVKLSPTPELSMQAFFGAKLVVDEKYLDFRCSINFRPYKIWKLDLDIYRSRSRINQAESIGILDRS